MTPYQVLPDLSAEDFAALRADIAARGVLVPVEYDEDGNILDGHHRVRACEELGLTDWPRFIRKGLSEADKRVHARQLNLARRHLNRDQKRDLIAAQLRETPEKSNRQVAEGLGVSHVTVATVRAEQEAGGQIDHHAVRVGKDGVTQPARKPIRTTFVDPTPAGQREVLDAAKAIRAEKAATSRAVRLDNLAEISRGNRDLATDVKYPIIYADPPWRYENPPIGATSRAIENHYPTMTLGRRVFAMEISPAYVDVAVERWQAETGLDAVLDGDGRNFAAVKAERLGGDTDANAAA